MTTEETELTFIRCPSCRSLVPAVATRCRMCGHVFESDSDEPEGTESLRKKSRVRQRTMSVSREEVDELTKGANDPEAWHMPDSVDSVDFGGSGEVDAPTEAPEELSYGSVPEREEAFSKPVDLADLLDAEQLEAYGARESDFESEPFGASEQSDETQAYTSSSAMFEEAIDFSDSSEEPLPTSVDEVGPVIDEPSEPRFGDSSSFGENNISMSEPAQKPAELRPHYENAPLRFREDEPAQETLQPPAEMSQGEESFDDNDDSYDADSVSELESDAGRQEDEDGGDVGDGEQPSRRKRRRRRRKRPVQESSNDQPEASEQQASTQSPVSSGELIREQGMATQETSAEDRRDIEQAPANQERRIQEVPRESKGRAIRTEQEGTLVGWFVTFARDGRGVSTEVRSGRYFLGREKLRDQDMVIGDTAISTPHCLITAAPGEGVRVQDLMSDQGTFIKKQGRDSFVKVEDGVIVEHGDALRFGAYEVLVCLVP